MLEVFLLILALICFIAATFGATIRSINLVALGLAFWVLALILGTGFLHVG